MTSDYTLEQKQALAMANARMRMAQSSAAPSATEKPSGMMADLLKRESNIRDISQERKKGNIGALQEALQKGGEGIGAITDVAGNVADRAVSALPDFMEGPIRQGGRAIEALGAESIHQAGRLPSFGGGTIGERIPQELAANPNLAKDISAAGNIAAFLVPGGTMSGAGRMTSMGDALVKAGEKQVADKRAKFISDLVSPKETRSVGEDLVSRTKETGPLKSKSTIPTSRESGIANEVLNIPGVVPGNSAQSNYNLIRDENLRIGKRLNYELKNMGGYFPRREFKKDIADTIQNELAGHPVLVGAAQDTADRIVNEFGKIVDSHPSTPHGLYEARKEFDGYIRNAFGEGVFDPEKENARKVVVRSLRNATNDFIADRAQSVSVKDALGKQHRLYSAMENIAPKAYDEGKDVVQRISKKLSDTVSLKGAIAGGTGLAGLGYSHLLSPEMFLGAGGLYLAGKAIGAAKTKKVLGNILQKTDQAIAMGHNDLKADRAALLDYIQHHSEENGEETK